jgi:hypothetical protein
MHIQSVLVIPDLQFSHLGESQIVVKDQFNDCRSKSSEFFVMSRPSRGTVTTPPLLLGSEFDITLKLPADGSPRSPSSSSSNPFGVHTFSATQPATIHVPKVPELPADSLITGTNATEVHHVELLSPRAIANQPPIAMARLSLAEGERAKSSQSVPTSRRTKSAKMFVFGYREAADYIPHPFISSHRPKLSGERTSQLVKELRRGCRKFDKPGRLSQRREVDVDLNFTGSIFVNTFDQFSEELASPRPDLRPGRKSGRPSKS